VSDERDLWGIAKVPSKKLLDQWKEDNDLEQKIEEHVDEFRPCFQENHEEDVPTHPYKIYREILVETEELSTEEKAALRALKDWYAEKWLEKKHDKVMS